jgi:hypothetical protein
MAPTYTDEDDSHTDPSSLKSENDSPREIRRRFLNHTRGRNFVLMFGMPGVGKSTILSAILHGVNDPDQSGKLIVLNFNRDTHNPPIETRIDSLPHESPRSTL